MRQERWIHVISEQQILHCYEADKLINSYPISTAKNGMGERLNSECTPRGRHQIQQILGLDNAINSVFVAREWTGEIYSETLAQENPGRDWILTRILRLKGMEPGFNQGGEVDSFNRYIYIHGTPDSTDLGKPGSRGCVRMRNQDIITLAQWVKMGTDVLIA